MARSPIGTCIARSCHPDHATESNMCNWRGKPQQRDGGVFADIEKCPPADMYLCT